LNPESILRKKEGKEGDWMCQIRKLTTITTHKNSPYVVCTQNNNKNEQQKLIFCSGNSHAPNEFSLRPNWPGGDSDGHGAMGEKVITDRNRYCG